MSKPADTKVFCAERAPGVDCFSDVDAEAYKTYGLTRANVRQVLSPSVIIAGIRAALGGYSQGATQGDGLRLPGTFVLDSNRRVLFAYYSSDVSDYPTQAELMRAITTVR